ncbi:hypothetical protein BCL57_000304 [Agromyces flavus]|uniref:Uncharacterized protein n=1 Tax=Agromyces flavus TaxID=589382 RepID=A0A1H1WFW9_9MICO|nr:hypothetical protein [Agromyces flavus]MCP2366162.1 hypothetical protein [Agromyces flavus]GGI44124.1 hypothetical protein GCM10010932_03040 [Agromyces flavus]SDS95912.1 hypothetical protein SAMN04489721_2233 [Agromyces flavus]
MESGSEPQQQPGSQSKTNGGWLARIPLWVRIVVPVLVLGALVVAVIVGVSASSDSDDPEDVAEALCREAVLEEMESTGRTAGDVSGSFTVTEAGDDEYRVQGTGTYQDEDGATKSGNVRCVVREEDDALEVASVRLDF